MENFCDSPFWDSNITWYTNNPKFTPCFEKTVLIWIPCTFLWIFAPVEITYIFKSRNRLIPWNFYNITKLLFNILLILISGLELSYAIYKKVQNDIALVEIFTPSIKILSFCLVFLVSQHNKYYGRRSSGLLFIFWLLFTICGLPQFRTEIENRISNNNDLLQFISYMIFYLSVVLKFLLNCFADKQPLIISNAEQEKPCPESECSFLSRIFYYWFNPLVRTGFKRPLIDNDLWSLDKENTSAEITSIFERHWNETFKKTERPPTFEYSRIVETNIKRQASILPALFKTFGPALLFSAFLELIRVAIIFSTPFFLSKLILFISNGEEIWKGYMYAILLFISATLRCLVVSQYNQKVKTLGMKICIALIDAVYKKSLKLSSNARKDAAVGEIVNLMSVDVQKFNEMAKHVNYIWSSPLQLCISLYFLWNILGPSVLAGLGVIIVLLPLNAVLVKVYEKSQTDQMESKDQRLKLMNEILNGIKVLKLYAWEPSFEAQITKIRNTELKSLKRIAYVNPLFSFIWLCVPFFVSLVIFATFVLSSSKNVLDSRTAFVALSLLNILQFPLTMFPYVVNILIQTFVSIKRLNKFMNSDEINHSNESLDYSDDCSLKIEDGSFSWDSEEPTLKDINIDVKAGSLVAIVGNVGSGKSSILSAVLGEMEKLSGQVSIRGSIAYVAQQAWIQNETLKNNILFRKNENGDFYNSVVDACALRPDLEMLPAGDQTEIGEKGINLSGGQKQRVSLARAVYFDSDVYLLDDPLSAVDSHVGKHIFEHVIGPKGLLNKKTRLLVTNAITYLPQVDHIVVLKDGTITEFGTYKELLEKKGSFADFLIQYISSIEEDDNSELLEIKKHLESNLGSDDVNNKLQRLRSISENKSDNASNKGFDNINSKITSATTLENTGDKIQNDKFIEEETAETGNIKWHVYVYYFKVLGPFLAMATFFSNAAYQTFSISTNIWLSKWSTTNDFNSTNGNDTHTRDLYLGIYGALGIGQAFAAYFYNLAPQLGFWFAAKMLHEKMLGRILRSPLSFFDTTPSGRILSRFSKDVDILDGTLPWVIAECIFCIFNLFGTLVVISMSTPLFITVILPVGVMYYFIQRYYIATSRQLRRLESVSRSPIYSHFQETLTGVSTVKAFGLQDTFIFESQDKVDYNNKFIYGEIVSNSWLTVRLEIMGNILTLFAALFVVISRNELSPGIVGLSVTYALQITDNLGWIVDMASELESNIVAVERIKEYSENVQEKPWVLRDSDPNNDWPSKGQLDINDLVLRYRSSNEPVLHKINCQIKSGEKIGVVGRTGAGKSSLALALFRIVETERGSILIDGLDISQLGLHTLRSRLSIIPQDPVLFMGSLRFNLDPFDVHTDEEIWSSLEHAHLKSHVENLTSKLEHEIEEAGANLSVGQRQLICLARALLRKSSILVLDEATAAVDLETDDLIQKTIRTEFSSCTILTIAHRLNTVLDSDKILVLDKGKLAEFDSPSNLLHNHYSLFYKLAKDAGII